MSLSRDQKALAAMFASKDSSSESQAKSSIVEDFLTFASSLDVKPRAALRLELDQYDVPKLQRALSRGLGDSERYQKPVTVEMDAEGNWFRGEEVIGRRRLFYKAVQPYEAQSRVAYDVFYQAIFATLARHYCIAVLQETQYSVELFVPTTVKLDFEALWDALVTELFSERSLSQTFVGLMRSIKLANRGFSAIDMPILTEGQARILAGFDLINLRSLLTGDDKLRRKIAELDRQLDDTDLDRSDYGKAKKQADDLNKELQVRVERYAPMYQQWQEVQEETPAWASAVLRAEKYYRTRAEQPLAGMQLAKTGPKIRKAVQQISDLGELVAEGRYARLDPLLSPTPLDVSVLPAGDGNTRVCYGCGRAMPKGDSVYQANTFIFAAPSQRLQSRGSQKQPNVCGTCAAVAFVSPIKLGEGRLVLRLKRIGEDEYSYTVTAKGTYKRIGIVGRLER